jgi:hypothetical protein
MDNNREESKDVFIERKAEAARSAPTSITGKSPKALFAFGDFSVMTSRG